MKQEDWDYIVGNWGSQDEVVQGQIAKIKDQDAIERNNLETKLKEREDEVLKLTQQNVGLNQTNMSLVLRLTDPSYVAAEETTEENYVAPKVDDYDKFWR